MVIDLTSQRAFVYRDGMLIGVSTISSGKPRYETPTGTFAVLEKQRFHHSNKYDDAPMPYMQRLSWSGLALHAGRVRSYPSSHGCIRMPNGFAAALFREETRGMRVVITGHAPDRAGTALLAASDNARLHPQSSTETGDWQAIKSGSGQGDGNAPDATPCCVPGAAATPDYPSALWKRAGDSKADDQADEGADDGDVDHNANQLQDDEGNSGQQQGQNDLDRSHEVSPQYLPPPPG